MELADERATRPRRVNAGSRLQELLEQGLGDEEEEALRAFSDASSDTSFTSDSNEELTDEVESDFSDEEIAGVLEGEIVETEESVWREERRERREAKNRLLARSRHFTERLANVKKVKEHEKRTSSNHSKQYHKHADKHKTDSKRHKQHHHHHHKKEKEQKQEEEQSHEESASILSVQTRSSSSSSSDADDEDIVSSGEDSDDSHNKEMRDEHDLRSAFRQRPAPTIPLAKRMQAALERAARVREAMRMQSNEGEIEYNSAMSDVDRTNSRNVVLSENWEKASNSRKMMNYAHGFNMGKPSHKRRRKNVSADQYKFAEKYSQEMWNGNSTSVQQRGEEVSANLLREVQNKRVKAYTGTVPSQRVLYRSGQSVLAMYGVPTIISFSHDLPPALQSTNSQYENNSGNNVNNKKLFNKNQKL